MKSDRSTRDSTDVPVDLATLMARAQAGDREAYRRLLKASAVWLKSYLARHWSGIPHAEREDVIQDVLLSLHTSRVTYDPARPFEAWLAALARNRASDHVRSSRRGRTISAEFAREAETFPVAVENNPYIDPVLSVSLATRIDQLPETQRNAVRMLRLEELSLKEASARSGLSVTALKVSLHRAVLRLRQLMND